ncbi:PHA/PHB synthase family protein [Kribbella shirazensis]|uniref:Class II poly(R)-hydroxyalkanoic acid synthase n=1 Tax=Kribbella shirazensis TaxID=1105143 RepID=A0A7X6A2G3_9ACTN|nr:alpha/beta fold hydrolase [Kribbella shirazensis]NIK58968.1 class II poly(R)-hydroxyalkanoic acid synthase [Kribbella shirazensis]
MSTPADELAAPLDLLLTSAAIGPLRRFAPNAAWARMATGLAAKPGTLGQRAAHLAGELGQIALGHSSRTPSRRDRRFADPAWTQNPVLRRIVQAYLAAAETAAALPADAGLGWRDRQRMTFVVDNLVEALAPSNNPVVNPSAWKALIDTAGLSSLAGARNLVRDLSTAPRVPSMVEPTAFEVGKTVAVTPGAVVFRNEVLELIQYAPQTEKVRTVPLLIVPPVINKYYVVDLAPGRSMVEYFVRQGQQVFTISWRNPDARHRDWDFDTYGAAILEAMDAVRRICRSATTHLFATCSGGILAGMLLGHLADRGDLDRVESFTLAVSVLDQSQAGLASAALDERMAAAAIASSASKGFLDGRALAEVFAWLRPTDLIWSYWVNNYLQGRAPTAFDVLFWNADTTRMTAALHRGFVEQAMTNALAEPGAATMLGSPVDLGKISTPSYVVAGIADHICPWQSCYRSTQLLGGPSRFVLSTAGHIASMVNPPDNPKATYQVNDDTPPEPDEWLRTASTEQGSWWPDYISWLGRRNGRTKPAPKTLGGGGLAPLEDAPGSYVRES